MEKCRLENITVSNLVWFLALHWPRR